MNHNKKVAQKKWFKLHKYPIVGIGCITVALYCCAIFLKNIDLSIAAVIVSFLAFFYYRNSFASFIENEMPGNSNCEVSPNKGKSS